MKRNFWPYAIVIYFAIFIAGVATWITFAVRNDQQLVRSDYYEQELKFQTELDERSRALSADVTVTYDAITQCLSVVLPPKAEKASLYLYRPSNAKLDRELPFSPNASGNKIDVRGFEMGFWKLHLTWTAAGIKCRHETAIVLEPTKLSSR